MSVSGDYAQPVPVNGYLCWNCGQVADAKQGVNPADVKPGETAAQAAAQTTSNTSPTGAVTFGGSLAGTPAASAAGAAAATPQGLGAWLNVAA